MKWSELKQSIVTSLQSRDLKNPNIRINALDRVEDLIKSSRPDLIKDPKNGFNSIDKDELKEQLSLLKDNGKLNSAEKSIINEIYYRI